MKWVPLGLVRYTLCLGGLSVFFFTLCILTGPFLMLYYVPDVNRAHADVMDISQVVPFGSFVRNVHRWAACLMVVSVPAHMLRVFLQAAYKPPRQLNWLVGVNLLVLTYLLAFTGYLLPWDQEAYWGASIGATMAENTPILGAKGPFSVLPPDKDMHYIMLGGTVLDQPALTRFFFAHCIAIPGAMAALMGFHFYNIHRAGGMSGPL
ncbi:MAG TPA: cytochrome b N-terminal domain-containing protein [Candidatus Hypogeohydataceae bacterium YC38]|jgi:quinol-cytochrome oxidoreductase complex cytochrome b subunit